MASVSTATPDNEDFADEAREVFDEGFAGVADDVRRATQRSTVPQASMGDATINLVTGLAVAEDMRHSSDARAAPGHLRAGPRAADRPSS